MEISIIIKQFFTHYFEDTIQNIEIISSIRSEDEINTILEKIDKEINFALNATIDELSEHYNNLGKFLYKNKISHIILMNVLEKLKNEITYAINHKNINYNENEFLTKIDNIIQNISKGYFHDTIKDILNIIKKESVFFEIDINSYKNWYEKFLNNILNDTNNKVILIYEESECFKWINSLDFKLLTKASNINTKTEIMLITEKIFEIAREIVLYKQKNNYKNAYSFLILLDQKINILNNLLKNISLKFINEKTKYFFDLFADLILFKKDFTFFLIFSIKPSTKIIHKKDINKAFLNIFKLIKQKVINLEYDFTGIIDNTNSIHFIISYKEKKQIKEIFNYIIKIVENYKNKELILNIPEFYLRAVDTEMFSGLNADTLKKIAFVMTKEMLDIPYYHFKKNESKNLISKAKKLIKINNEIQKALKNKKIDLFFQPIVHITNNKTSLEYCEALSRINFKNEKIDMQQFVDYVVEENFTDDFDKIVFEKLNILTPDIAKYLKGVSVNIFPTSFLNADVIDLLRLTLEKFKKYNLKFILEITEYYLFEYYLIIKKLRNEYPQTLKIAIDDFGSGYSSFSTLIKLSKNNLLDIIKIDGSITKEILNNELSFDILKMSVEIVKKLNKKVIIEYVENEKIKEKIRKITNDFYAQGFLYSKALPLEQIKEIKF